MDRVALSVVRQGDLCAALMALDMAQAAAESPGLYDLGQVAQACKDAGADLRRHNQALGAVARGEVVRVHSLRILD